MRTRLRTIDLEGLDGVVGGGSCQRKAPYQWANLANAEASGNPAKRGGLNNSMCGLFQFAPWTWNMLRDKGVHNHPGDACSAPVAVQEEAACYLYCKTPKGAKNWLEHQHLLDGAPC